MDDDNYVDVQCEIDYIYSDFSDIDQGGDEEDDDAYTLVSSSHVTKDMSVQTKATLSTFIANHQAQVMSEYIASNEVPRGVDNQHSSSSYPHTSSSAIVRYPNHEQLQLQITAAYNNKLGNDQRCVIRRIVQGMKANVLDSPHDQLLFFLSGAGGTGKTECIKLLGVAAKLIFGMKGPYEPLVNLAPTGSAACNIDGFTWQSFLHVDKSRGIISQRSAESLGKR